MGSAVPDSAPPAPPFRRRGRIVLSLLAALVLVAVSPLATAAWKLIDINREALTTAQQEFQLLLASAVAGALDSHLEALRAQVARVAQTLGAASHAADAAPAQEIVAVLREIAEPPVLYVEFGYAGARGGGAISAGELPEGLAGAFRVTQQAAVESLSREHPPAPGLVIVSDPLLHDAGVPRALVPIAAPVLSGGRLRGVLCVLVDLQAVWKETAGALHTGHEMFVVNETGAVLASTDPERIRPGRDASGSELARRFLGGAGRARETMPYVEDGSRESYLGSYASTAQGWGVFVRARERDVYRPVRTMIESTLAWVAGVLGLAAIVAMYFARSLSGPIERLSAAARGFAAGDLRKRVRVRGRNELGELAFAFNRMADEIEQQIHQLRRAADEHHELFLGTIRALAQAIDAKDPYTRGHSVRVNRYAVAIARNLGLNESQVRDIHVASLLHDVGKIGVHDSVLNKPGKLTPAEFAEMKAHTTLGAAIMAPIRQMGEILPGLRSHHERWKGGGYPDGLVGEDIPLMARIIAVADTFDAVTTTRPYQKTMTIDEAFETINRLKGEALDERVVEAFYRAYLAGQIRPEAKEDGAAEAVSA